MKIIAVGWNYMDHNKEMKTSFIPQEPILFSKPDSALLRDGKPFFLPDFSQQIEYETELVVRISRLGKNISPQFAHRYYDAYTVGIDFTARDLQSRLREKGQPWEISKGFDGSAVLGEMFAKEKLPPVQELNFSLNINEKQVQKGWTKDMLFSVDQIISYASRFFTLKIGDLIYTGTPVGVGPVKVDDHLQGYLEGKKVLDFYVR